MRALTRNGASGAALCWRPRRFGERKCGSSARPRNTAVGGAAVEAGSPTAEPPAISIHVDLQPGGAQHPCSMNARSLTADRTKWSQFRPSQRGQFRPSFLPASLGAVALHYVAPGAHDTSPGWYCPPPA